MALHACTSSLYALFKLSHNPSLLGCDASILLDSNPKNPVEKDNVAHNPTLQVYDVIDEAKAELKA